MARAPRIDYAGAVQHVAVNGNNRQPMFLSDADRVICLSLLGSTARRYGWQVLAYCLMDTHWHALLRTTKATLSLGMQRLNSCYSRTFNTVHDRSGHSIRHRYMSVPVEDGAHLMELTRYIPLNPVRAGLASHPEHWRWSSHRAQLGIDPTPAWLETQWLSDLHGSPEGMRRFVAEGMEEPGTHWAPGSPLTPTPPRPEAGTAPRRPASA
jgi:putative transposase